MAELGFWGWFFVFLLVYHSIGWMYGVGMWARKKKECPGCKDAQEKLATVLSDNIELTKANNNWDCQYRRLAKTYDGLVNEINKRGGWKFLNRNVKTSYKYTHPFTEKEIKKLLMLCHSDKHSNSDLSKEMTQKLLDVKAKL